MSLVPAALSWVNALCGPRDVGLGVASVEWLRQKAIANTRGYAAICSVSGTRARECPKSEVAV